MNQRKKKSVQSRLKRLAANECANHEGKDGCKFTRHGLCVVGIETDELPGNVCPYFMCNVLPADAELFDEYLDYFPRGHPLKKEKPNLKPCERCGDLFEKRSSRAKYCDDCKVKVKRDQTRWSKQRTRSNVGK
jgi:hypothetical protein